MPLAIADMDSSSECANRRQEIQLLEPALYGEAAAGMNYLMARLRAIRAAFILYVRARKGREASKREIPTCYGAR